MIQDVRLENNVELFVGENQINPCTYITLVFTGGSSAQKYLELAHLCEHIVSTFDYKIHGKKSSNRYMGDKKADARVESECMMFSFCINSNEDLKEKLDVLTHCLNSIVIEEDNLQKEKITILDELIQADMSDEYIKKVKKDFEKITPNDVYEYIQNNLTADNLKIFALSNMDKKQLIETLNEFTVKLNLTGHKNAVDPNFRGIWYYDKKKEQGHTEIKLSLKAKKCLQTKNDKYMFVLLLLYANNFRYGIKRALRQESRLVYRTDISTNGFETADLILKISCKDENVEQVTALSKQYFDNLFKQGISEQEFDFIKQIKQDFLRARPFHIPQYMIREFILEYTKTHNQNLDETMQKQLLEKNQEVVKNFDKERIEETIKDIETLKYEDFNRFLSKYFENTDIKFELNNKTEINV